ncbi:MAG TPA: hypothetical protein VFG84_05580 [Gemmatimonadaceae bacterium]|nr:hypothetical protein [Gemmatimonadaceae bacterium]
MATSVLTAALAGLPSGIQAQGVWQGRRQLFVRFAGEAETATMYRADALAREVDRVASRAAFHSLCVTGRDAMGSAEFLDAVLGMLESKLPVMVDTDGQRPEAVGVLAPRLGLVQVTLDTESAGLDGPAIDRAIQTLQAAAESSVEHALCLVLRDDVNDGQILRVVERAHAGSDAVAIILHPGPEGERTALARRWALLVEQAMTVHPDIRLTFRLPGPAALR